MHDLSPIEPTQLKVSEAEAQLAYTLDNVPGVLLRSNLAHLIRLLGAAYLHRITDIYREQREVQDEQCEHGAGPHQVCGHCDTGIHPTLDPDSEGYQGAY